MVVYLVGAGPGDPDCHRRCPCGHGEDPFERQQRVDAPGRGDLSQNLRGARHGGHRQGFGGAARRDGLPKGFVIFAAKITKDAPHRTDKGKKEFTG